MSEDEIEKKLQNLIHKSELMMSTSTEFIGTDIKVSMSEDDKKVLLDLISLCLDLNREYNKEKEKNKKAIEYMERYEVNSTGKPFRYTEIGKELCEILEERN